MTFHAILNDLLSTSQTVLLKAQWSIWLTQHANAVSLKESKDRNNKQ